MQTFNLINENKTVYEGLLVLNDALLSLQSSFSGSVPPLTSKPGQLFFNENTNKLYLQKFGAKDDWKLIADLTGNYTTQEYVNAQVAKKSPIGHDHDTRYLGISERAVDSQMLGGKKPSEYLSMTQVSSDPNLTSETYVPSSKAFNNLFKHVSDLSTAFGNTPAEAAKHLRELVSYIEANSDLLKRLTIGNIVGLKSALDLKMSAAIKAEDIDGVSASKGGEFRGNVDVHTAGASDLSVTAGIPSADCRITLFDHERKRGFRIAYDGAATDDTYLQSMLDGNAIDVAIINKDGTYLDVITELREKGVRVYGPNNLPPLSLLKVFSQTESDGRYVKASGGTSDNANKLSGLVASTASTANTIAQRDSQGDLAIRTARIELGAMGDADINAITHLYGAKGVGKGSDNYVRPLTIAQIKMLIGIHDKQILTASDMDKKYLLRTGGILSGNIGVEVTTDAQIRLDAGTNKNAAIYLTEDNKNHGFYLRYKGADSNVTTFGTISSKSETSFMSVVRGANYPTFVGTPKVGANPLYHAGNKPTPAALGVFPSSGGALSGDILYGNQRKISWTSGANTAFVELDNSFMSFQVGNAAANFFRFAHKSGTSVTELLTIKTDHLRFKGKTVYHEANLPSPSILNVFSKAESDTRFLGFGDGSYSLLLGKKRSDSDWLRVTKNGLLPYSNGVGALGTSSWRFSQIHGITIYENNVSLASKYLGVAAKAADSALLEGKSKAGIISELGSNFVAAGRKVNGKPLTSDVVITTSDLSVYTKAEGNAIYAPHKSFDAKIRKDKWSRIAKFAKSSGIAYGGAFRIILGFTRGSVVSQQTFDVSFSHSVKANIFCTDANKYTALKVRVVMDGGNNAYLEAYGGASGTAYTDQVCAVEIVSISRGLTVTPYTTWADGTTIPTSWKVAAECESSTSGPSYNNHVLFHEGHIPTLSELGAASATHNHDTVYLGKTAKAADSDKVDGIHGASLVRKDADSSYTSCLISTNRANGLFGVYDSQKTQSIWSMGTAYKSDVNGANFGKLYGLGYKHTNNKTGGTMAGGHQMVWCENGIPKVALGDGLWTAGNFTAMGTALLSGAVTMNGLALANKRLNVKGGATIGGNQVTNTSLVVDGTMGIDGNEVYSSQDLILGTLATSIHIKKGTGTIATFSVDGLQLPTKNLKFTGNCGVMMKGKKVLHNHDNGNITLSAALATGDLILGYKSGTDFLTRNILMNSPTIHSQNVSLSVGKSLNLFAPNGETSSNIRVWEGGATRGRVFEVGSPDSTSYAFFYESGGTLGRLMQVNGELAAAGAVTGKYSGSFSFSGQYSTKAAFYESVTTAGTSEYHPLVKQKMANSGQNYTFSMGTLINSHKWCLQYIDSAAKNIVYYWDRSGNFTSSGDVTAFSDIRLKSDIRPITDALSKVQKINGYTFVKEGSDKRKAGVIAQEIEKVLPEVVLTEDDEINTKSVAYGNITALLIEAIKELKLELDELRMELKGVSV